MCDNTNNVAVQRVYNGQTVHFVFGQHVDRIIERVLRLEANKRSAILLEHFSPRVDLVLLQFFDFGVGFFVIFLEYENEVGDGEHSDKFLILRIPKLVLTKIVEIQVQVLKVFETILSFSCTVFKDQSLLVICFSCS